MLIRRWSVVVAAAVVAFAGRGPAWAQPGVPDITAPTGDLARRLEDLCERLEKRRQEHHIPGLALAVVQDDRLLLARGFGVRDVERNLPASEDTLFAIGSSTKAFTALLCAMMVEEGKMSWDQPVRAYLPGFALSDENATQQATIVDLLSHRTGLARTDMLWGGGTASREQILTQITRARLKDPFRAKFNYNNVMFLAAGTAAANLAGTDWDSMVKARILDPLGMSASTTRIRDMISDPRASKGYMWEEEKNAYKFRKMRELGGIAPAGAINSNVLDMSRWVRLQLGRGTFAGKKLISPEHLEATWARQIAITPQAGYAMGWMVHEWNGKRVVEHGGNIDGFAAEVAMLPDEKVGLVLLANVGATPLQGGIQSMVWETFFPPAPAAEGAIAAGELEQYLGKYRFDQLGVDCTTLVRDGKLCLDVPNQTVYELKWPDAEGKWVFAMTDAIKVRFERGSDNAVVAMTLFQSGLEFRLPREGASVAEEKPPLPMDELRAHTGRYNFPPKNEEWPVVLKNGRLAIDVPGQMLYVLDWPRDGRWAFQVKKDIELEFTKGPDGKVESVILHQDGQHFTMPRIAGSGDAALPSLDELMHRRQTVGGGAAVAGLGDVRVTGKVEMVHQGIDGSITLLFAGTDRFRQEMDFGAFGSIRTASDGTSVWVESMGEELTLLEGKRRDEAIRQAIVSTWADLRTEFDEIEVDSVDTIDGHAVAVVKASKKDGTARTRMFLSQEDGLPRRIDATITIPGIGGLPVRIAYSDYRDIGGALLPFKAEVQTDAAGTTVITYEKSEIGVKTEPDAYVLKPRSP